MDASLKAKWVEALRSGEYKQGKTWLLQGDKYCCLGVLCVVGGVSPADILGKCTTDTPGLISGLDDRTRSLLGDEMNDQGGKSFEQIADYIEANIPAD